MDLMLSLLESNSFMWSADYKVKNEMFSSSYYKIATNLVVKILRYQPVVIPLPVLVELDRCSRCELKFRHTMLDRIYDFLHANFYKVVHRALYSNVYNFNN